MIDLQPIVADYAPRPKRKYTVTDRVRAACRANLERANAVPWEIRFRSTEKRRHACHHNLTLALIAKKRDRSPRYATCFRNGWYVPDPERALALAGATPEEYHRHLEAWRREVQPRDSEEAKLAHALGMLSWRWITGVRLQGDRETLRVYRLLDALGAERGGSTPTPGGAIDAVPPGCAPDAPLPAPSITLARLTQLGYGLEEALRSWTALEAPLDKIRDRMLRIWQELLRMRGEPLMDLRAIGCFGRPHEVAIDHELYSPYTLAEPFQSSGATEQALGSKSASLIGVEHWRKPAPAAAPGALSAQPTPGAGPAAPAAGLALEQVPRHDDDEFLEGIPAAEGAGLREARLLGRQLPGSFEEFLQRVRRALGTLGAGAGARAQSQWVRRVVGFARALWKRLGALRRHADEVLNWLNRHLGDRGVTLWPEGTPRPEFSARVTLHATLEETLNEPESQAERRGEGLAEFYFQSLAALAHELIERGQRCRAGIAVVCRRE